MPLNPAPPSPHHPTGVRKRAGWVSFQAVWIALGSVREDEMVEQPMDEELIGTNMQVMC